MRLNLQTKLVIATVVLLTTVCMTIGISTIINVRQQLSHAIAEKAKSDVKTSREIIDRLVPGPWSNQNGVLYKGNVKINDNFAIVDKIAELTENTVTIFLNDTRVTTTLIQDGQRAVGTKAAANVVDTVLHQRQDYRGEANVLGVKHHTNYTPLQDANGEIIGMFYEGVSKQFVDELEQGFISRFVGIVAFSLLLASLVGWYLGRRMARPIMEIAGMAEQIAAGDFSINPSMAVTSRDEVGHLAAAFYNMATQLGIREEALLKSEENYRTLVDNICVGIYRNTADVQGRFLQVNPATARMFGYDSVEEFMTVQTVQLYQKPEERGSYLEQIYRDGFVIKKEIAMKKKDGSLIWCSCSATAQYGEDGKIEWLDTVLEDITVGKQAEEALWQLNNELEYKVEIRTQDLFAANQEMFAMNAELTASNQALSLLYQKLQTAKDSLVRSEKMVALARLVAGMAHEINTPVGICVTLASHMDEITKALANSLQIGALRRSDLEGYIAECGEVAHMLLLNSDRAAKLVSNFKQVSADQASEIRRNFDVGKYIREILVTLTVKLKDTGHRINIHCEDNLQMDGYPGAFGQILTNLILNSLIHGYEGDEAGTINIMIAVNGEWLIMTYSDDGKGIPDDVINKIFDPFFTTKRNSGGTGLGLCIVYNLVTQLYGGTIECLSQPKDGTTFITTIPLTQAVRSEDNDRQ